MTSPTELDWDKYNDLCNDIQSGLIDWDPIKDIGNVIVKELQESNDPIRDKELLTDFFSLCQPMYKNRGRHVPIVINQRPVTKFVQHVHKRSQRGSGVEAGSSSSSVVEAKPVSKTIIDVEDGTTNYFLD